MDSQQQSHARVAQARAYSMLFVAQLAMGSGGIFGRLALDKFGPLATAGWRLGLAALPLVGRFLWRDGPKIRHHQEWLMALAGVLLGLQFAAWTGSLQRLSIGASTLLMCTAPLWNGLYEHFILKRRLSHYFWVALLLATAGIALMVQGAGEIDAPVPNQTAIGMALALFGSLGMAAYFILIRHIAVRAEAQQSYDTLDIITRTYTVAAVLLLAASCFESQPLPPIAQWHAWSGILGMALIAQGLGHTLQNAALRHVRASLVGFATLIEPLVATVLASFLFGESLTWRAGIGGALVLLAVVWALKLTAEPGVPRSSA